MLDREERSTATMRVETWKLGMMLFFCLPALGSSRSDNEPLLSRRRRAPVDDAKRCSYTFLVPQQRITGPICASTTGPEPEKDRVTRMDISDLKEVLSKQRREIETLQLVTDVDSNLVNEMKLLRKESRNMNSRVTQLYMQLLHEIIRKRDNSLELVQLENRVLNVTSEMLRLATRYKELELRFASLAATVNNQSVLISMLEEHCMRGYGRQELPAVPPLVQVVPETIPANNNRFTNEIHRDHNNRAFPRGSRMDVQPTADPVGDPPAPKGTLNSDGNGIVWDFYIPSTWGGGGGLLVWSISDTRKIARIVLRFHDWSYRYG